MKKFKVSSLIPPGVIIEKKKLDELKQENADLKSTLENIVETKNDCYWCRLRGFKVSGDYVSNDHNKNCPWKKALDFLTSLKNKDNA